MVILFMEHPEASRLPLLPVVFTTALDAERNYLAYQYDNCDDEDDDGFHLPKIVSVTSLSSNNNNEPNKDVMMKGRVDLTSAEVDKNYNQQTRRDDCCKRKSLPSSTRLCIKQCKVESKQALEFDILSPTAELFEPSDNVFMEKVPPKRTVNCKCENGRVCQNVSIFYPAWSSSNRWKIQKSLMKNVVKIMGDKPLTADEISSISTPLPVKKEITSSASAPKSSDCITVDTKPKDEFKITIPVDNSNLAESNKVILADHVTAKGDRDNCATITQTASVVKLESLPEQHFPPPVVKPRKETENWTHSTVLFSLHADNHTQLDAKYSEAESGSPPSPHKKCVKETVPAKKWTSPRKSSRKKEAAAVNNNNNMSKIDKLKEMLRQKQKDLEEMRRGNEFLK